MRRMGEKRIDNSRNGELGRIGGEDNKKDGECDVEEEKIRTIETNMEYRRCTPKVHGKQKIKRRTGQQTNRNRTHHPYPSSAPSPTASTAP